MTMPVRLTLKLQRETNSKYVMIVKSTVTVFVTLYSERVSRRCNISI